jgi:hypothetical protein
MRAYGIPPDRLHSMVNPLQVKRDQANGKFTMPKNTNTWVVGDFKVGDKIKFEHTNRQRVVTTITATVSKVNLKTVKAVCSVTGGDWTIYYTCDSLRKA